MNFWAAALALTVAGGGAGQATQEEAQKTFRFEAKVSNVYVDAFVVARADEWVGVTLPPELQWCVWIATIGQTDVKPHGPCH